MWNTECGRLLKPLRNVFSSAATGKFAEPQFLFCEDLSTNVASRLRHGSLGRFIYQLDEHLGRSQRVLNCSHTPRMKIAQAMDALLWMTLEPGRLKLFQETAERTSGFLQHLQNRLRSEEHTSELQSLTNLV